MSLTIISLASSYRRDGGWVIDSGNKPVPHDFVNFYSAGMLVERGKPAEAYDWRRQQAAQRELVGTHHDGLLPWPYPPFALPVAQLLSLPSYPVSFLLFVGLSFAICALAAMLIVGTLSSVVWLAGSSLAFINIYVGQNGLMSAGLLGLALVLLPKRPVWAGVLFGCLAFKPHLGLLLPIFLIILGQWRAFMSAAVTVLAAIGISLALYGAGPWLAFISQLGRTADLSMGLESTVITKLQSVYAVLRSLGVGTEPAMAAHAATAAAALAVAIWVWRADTPYPIKAALLPVATALLSPYLFFYDLALLLITVGFLVRYLMERDAHLSLRMGIVLLGLNFAILLYPLIEWPTGLAATLILGGISVTLATRHNGVFHPSAAAAPGFRPPPGP